MEKIFSNEQVLKYAKTRLFGRNISPSDVHEITLYNAVLPKDLRCMIKHEHGDDFILVDQSNPREPIYFHNGILFIPQYSGFKRRERYESMIDAFVDVYNAHHKHKISFSSVEGINERRNDQAYNNFAYDFVAGLFVPDNTYEARRVFPGKGIKDIRKIIFGSTKAVERNCKVIKKQSSKYLSSLGYMDAQIIEVGGEPVLNIGYVYGDQAGTIIDKMLVEYNSLSRSIAKDNIIKIDMYMFGRVASLDPSFGRNALILPNKVIDESSLLNGAVHVDSLNNVLANPQSNIVNLNVESVINESFESLMRARELGCSCVEMETRACSSKLNEAQNNYKNIRASFGFVGHVSDKPLVKGESLADEFDVSTGEDQALELIVNRIINCR